jgi:hypothetical protein
LSSGQARRRSSASYFIIHCETPKKNRDLACKVDLAKLRGFLLPAGSKVQAGEAVMRQEHLAEIEAKCGVVRVGVRYVREGAAHKLFGR